jgi:hypothetical protein
MARDGLVGGAEDVDRLLPRMTAAGRSALEGPAASPPVTQIGNVHVGNTVELGPGAVVGHDLTVGEATGSNGAVLEQRTPGQGEPADPSWRRFLVKEALVPLLVVALGVWLTAMIAR